MRWMTLLVLFLPTLAMADDLPVEPPAGTEEMVRKSAEMDGGKTAVFAVFAAKDGDLKAVAMTFKNGEERSRKDLDLKEWSRDGFKTLLVEDPDEDSKIEAILLAKGGDSLEVRAWEFVGSSLFTEPDLQDWQKVIDGSSRSKAVEDLHAYLEKAAREGREAEIIFDAMQDLVPALEKCAEKAVLKHGISRIELLIGFSVDPRGNVKSTRLVKSNLNLKPAEKCVEKEVAHLDFRGQVQGPVDIEYPLDFSAR